MEVGREMCNLNKSIFINCLQNNKRKHSNQAISFRAILGLYSHKIRYFHSNNKGQALSLRYNKLKSFNTIRGMLYLLNVSALENNLQGSIDTNEDKSNTETPVITAINHVIKKLNF